MNNDLDVIEALLDDADFGEFEEALPRPGGLRTPSNRSSFAPRTPPAAASQGQVQAAARTLDGKIETLSDAVKALENRTSAVSAKVDRTASGLAKHAMQRKKADDGLRADLQQTRMLAVLLPMLTQKTMTAQDNNGVSHEVVTQSGGSLGSLLPLMMIMPGMSSGEGARGPFGGDMLTTLLLFKVILDKDK